MASAFAPASEPANKKFFLLCPAEHKRKNFYFFGSEEAGLQASVMLSLLSSCVRNSVEPGAYLYDVLVKLTINPHHDPEELMPHVWQPAEITDVKDAPQFVSV